MQVKEQPSLLILDVTRRCRGAAGAPLEKDKAGALRFGSRRQRGPGRIRDKGTVPGHHSPRPQGRRSQSPRTQPARRRRRIAAAAAGAGVTAHEIEPAQWPEAVEGERTIAREKAPAQRPEAGELSLRIPYWAPRILPATPPATPRAAPPGHRTLPPRGPESSLPGPPPELLTRPGGPCNFHRRRHRPLRPRPSNDRCLPTDPQLPPPGCRTRNHFLPEPPRSALPPPTAAAMRWVGSADSCSEQFPSLDAPPGLLWSERLRPLLTIPTTAALSRARAPSAAPPAERTALSIPSPGMLGLEVQGLLTS